MDDKGRKFVCISPTVDGRIKSIDSWYQIIIYIRLIYLKQKFNTIVKWLQRYANVLITCPIKSNTKRVDF